MITKEIKQRILAAVAANRVNYPSDAKHAAALGLNTSIYSGLKNGQTENIHNSIEWKPAKTPTYQYITAQLEFLQQSGISGILCDYPNIGKTFTARLYVQTHKNAVYVDCSKVKTKLNLIRNIANEFVVGSYGRYTDVYYDVV